MLKISSILGNSQKLDGGAMFGNVPKAMWEQWVTVDADNRIDLFCRAMLIQDQSSNKNILLETGIGAFFEPKYKERFGVVESHHVLLESLKEVGLAHEDIDLIILSHLHFDHAGGLLSEYVPGSEPHLLFPNAKYCVSVDAFERAKQPHPRDKASFIPQLVDLLSNSKRLELISQENINFHGVPLRFIFSEGHTPGLMLTEITTTDGPIVFAADLIPGTPWVHAPVTMGYDRFPEKIIDEKIELLNYLSANNGKLFFTHDVKCAMAQVVKDDKGRFSTTDCLDYLKQKVYNG